MSDAKTLTVVTIVPAEKAGDSRAHFARGTKILLSDGSELSAREVTISTHKDGLWIASIEVLMELAPTFVAQAEVVHAKAPVVESPHVLGYLDGRPQAFSDEAKAAMRLVEEMLNGGHLVLVHDRWNRGAKRFVGAPSLSSQVPVAVQGAE